MIPDFKTYIKESIWSDIQDRSSGETIRKEDEKFFKTIATYIQVYVNKEMFTGRYQFGVMSEFMHFINDYANNIKIEPLDPDIDMIKRYVRKNWESIEDVFLDLHELYKHVTLDNVMEMMKSKCILKESIWSDIQDRSSGDTIKKEDDIDLLDRDDFYDYIRKYYIETKSEIENTILNWNPSMCIIIPVIGHLYKSKKHIDLTYQYNIQKPEKYLYISTNVKSEPEFYELLKNKYSLVKMAIGYYIKPKDSIDDDVPNSFVIDVLNYIVDTPCDTCKKLIEKI